MDKPLSPEELLEVLRRQREENERRRVRVEVERLLRARMEKAPVPAAPEEYWPGRWIDWV